MRKPIFILLSLSLAISAMAQTKRRNFRQHELGLLIGGSYYQGELNPGRPFYMTQPAVGVFYRFTPNYRYAFRAGFNFGTIKGDDSQSDLPDQLERNLNFRSRIAEFNVVAEFNFLEYRISNDKHFFSPYIFLGLAGYYYNPMALYQNQWYQLQPLHTEGQEKGYKRVQMSIPFGLGIKLNVAKNLGIGIEWGPRKTYTDYLDDVSGTYPDPVKNPPVGVLGATLSDRSRNPADNINKQRGNPRNKDWYFFTGLSLNFKLRPKAVPCHAYD